MTPEQQKCPKCGLIKYKSQFHKSSTRASGIRTYCKACEYTNLRDYRINNPTKAQQTRIKNKLKYRYNISIEEYETLVNQSDSKCFICNLPETAVNSKGEVRLLSVDHCHTTQKVRGLLCHKCNAGLGYFRDSIENLKNAIQYLENHDA